MDKTRNSAIGMIKKILHILSRINAEDLHILSFTRQTPTLATPIHNSTPIIFPPSARTPNLPFHIRIRIRIHIHIYTFICIYAR